MRLYNPDFRIDATLKADFVGGNLSSQILDAFNAAAASLSARAALSPGRPQYDGTVWAVQDGALTYLVRDLPWMNADLEVYLARSPEGLASLPTRILLSITMRRALRVKANEGRVIEDVGIVPDVHYRMTLRDVMEKNQDLFERASKELSSVALGRPKPMLRL